jgi:hypothetical protein
MPLTIHELKTCLSFIKQARALCEGVRDFFLGHDADCAARLGDITLCLKHEGEYVQRLLTKASPNGGEKNV